MGQPAQIKYPILLPSLNRRRRSINSLIPHKRNRNKEKKKEKKKHSINSPIEDKKSLERCHRVKTVLVSI
jgi:hypothetical protein